MYLISEGKSKVVTVRLPLILLFALTVADEDSHRYWKLNQPKQRRTSQ